MVWNCLEYGFWPKIHKRKTVVRAQNSVFIGNVTTKKPSGGSVYGNYLDVYWSVANYSMTGHGKCERHFDLDFGTPGNLGGTVKNLKMIRV